MNSKSLREEELKFNNRPFVGVAVLLWKGDCLLLGQRVGSQGADVWQFPGGHLEVGESVLECAAREVREEAGLDISFAEHAAFTDEMFSAGGRDYITLYVTAACLSGEPVIMEPDKCRSWQWFPYNQLPDPLFSPIINFLKQVPDLSEFRVGPDTRLNERK